MAGVAGYLLYFQRGMLNLGILIARGVIRVCPILLSKPHRLKRYYLHHIYC